MVAIRIASLFTVATAFISTGVHAYGQIAQVIDANNFCIFLPPSDSADRGIASTEWNAEAFCTGNTPQAKNAGKIPSGFIQSAHFLATDTYVQVTGQISPTKGRLDPKDDGGQYDIKAPVGSSCAGWKYYVNLVEPSGNTYCMRCCNDPKTCNRGISEKGCAHIIPGDYSGPNGGSSTSNEDKTTGNTTTTTTTKKDSTNSAKITSTTTTGASPMVTIYNNGNTPASNTTDNVAKDSHSSTDSTKNTDQMLSQNDKVTEQSVSGAAGQFQPATVMTLAIVTLALMISH